MTAREASCQPGTTSRIAQAPATAPGGAPGQSPRQALSAAQHATFVRDGSLFPVPLLDAAATRHYRGLATQLMTASGLDQHSGYLTQMHLYLDWLRELATLPTLLDTIEDLLGPDLLIHTSSLFIKSPHDPTRVLWHQDGYFLGLDRPALVTAWIALSPATVANGCLRIVPGSHQDGTLPHHTAFDNHQGMLSSGLELDAAIDPGSARDVTLASGEMALHHVDVVHGSEANCSGDPRIGFAVRYIPADLGQRNHHSPVLLARGSDRNRRLEHYTGAAGNDLGDALRASAALAEQTTQARLKTVQRPP